MKVSILSPVHNEADHIKEMIGSVLSQSYPNFELLLVDDGSTDATVEIASRYAKEDKRITVLGEGGARGKVASFNLAFEHATGDVIVLLAGDDRLPPDSLRTRVAAVSSGLEKGAAVAAFFKLISFSEEPKFDGMILPRGHRAGRSGGTIAISNQLASLLFPIDPELAAEDIWLGKLCEYFADVIVELPEIVLEYRIHSGNSHPRHQSFQRMTESIHKRMLPFSKILESDRISLDDNQKAELRRLIAVEECRYSGRTLRIILMPRVRIVDKLRALSSSSRFLYGIRSKFYASFSGW